MTDSQRDPNEGYTTTQNNNYTNKNLIEPDNWINSSADGSEVSSGSGGQELDGAKGNQSPNNNNNQNSNNGNKMVINCDNTADDYSISLTCDTTIVQKYKATIKFNQEVDVAFQHFKAINSLLQTSIQAATVDNISEKSFSTAFYTKAFLSMFESLSKDESVTNHLNIVKGLAASFRKVDCETQSVELADAFKTAYEGALNNDAFTGSKFGKPVEDQVIGIMTQEGNSVINFSTLFGTVVNNVKHKMYNPKMQGESKAIFKKLSANNFAGADSYQDHGTNMHEAFTNLCRIEYNQSGDPRAAEEFCNDDYVSAVYNLFENIGLYA